jgi:ketosteroid isomerase-like protein
MPYIKEVIVHPNIAIAERWFTAFNTHDIEALLSLYDDSARHYSPKLKARQPQTKGWIQGKAALRDWWQDAFERLPTLHYEATKLSEKNGVVAMEYIRSVDGEKARIISETLKIKRAKIILSRVLGEINYQPKNS